VALRFLYESPWAPDPVVVTALRGTLQAVLLLLCSRLGQKQSKGSEQPSEGDAAATGSLLQQWLGQQSAPLWMAALELGMLCYAAATLQVCALKTHTVLVALWVTAALAQVLPTAPLLLSRPSLHLRDIRSKLSAQGPYSL
jgi:hypothetical protein